MKNWILSILLFTATANAFAKLSPLAPQPDWGDLNQFQETITHQEFLWLLENVYAPGGAWSSTIEVSENSARIQTNGAPYILRFAADIPSSKPVTRYWNARRQLPPPPSGKPFTGLKIAIDPGHLGGSWAKIEERWFQIGRSKPVTEGDMTLYVAKLLAPRLKELGAEVFLTRTKSDPVTPLRPKQLMGEARKSLAQNGTSLTAWSLAKESERLFYRTSEIRQRGKLVNERIRPDLVLCLHFNAEDWGNAERPTLSDENHLHFLISGALNATELAYDDQRFDMLYKLLSRSFGEELAVTRSVAAAMARQTNLPPFTYKGGNAINVGGNPYIWARNLLANRSYECPVVYVEPYVMNSREVFARIQAGDYSGTQVFGGVQRKSIFREYADSLVEGLANYYSKRD